MSYDSNYHKGNLPVKLKNEPNIIPFEELMTILGGCYGGPTDSWDSVGGFLNNADGMIGAELFNYSGTGDYAYTYGVQYIGTGFNFGSGSYFGSSIPQGSWSFSLGSNFSIGLGSGTYNGSLY